MLTVQGLAAGYGPVEVLTDISLHVARGEVVAVLGSNGAGKSTLLGSLVGIVPPRSGMIEFDGQIISGRPTEEIVGAGLTLVPEGRHVFARLTVAENLRMGAYRRRPGETKVALDRVLDLFPILAERRHQPAGTLSGGEQQQLAIGRAMMSGPKMMLLDEPSLGLAPVIVGVVFDLIREVTERDGMTVILVEQSISHALEISSRVYVMAGGKVVAQGTAAEMSDATHQLESSYLGA